MKNLSGRLARKLQQSASLVNAGLSNQIQSVLDAAVVDRCDFVEICCSDAPCLAEAIQQRGISSSTLSRSDGVGNHDEQTREKLLGWVFCQKISSTTASDDLKSWICSPSESNEHSFTNRSSKMFGAVTRHQTVHPIGSRSLHKLECVSARQAFRNDTARQMTRQLEHDTVNHSSE